MTVESPTADTQSIHVFPDTARTITLSGSDPNKPPLPLTFAVTAPPSHGALSGAPPNLTFTPETGFTGADQFTFSADNGITNPGEANIYLTLGEFESGEWSKTVPVKCPCDCSLAPVEVFYSERTDSGSGFTDWSDYALEEQAASNTDPSSGGTEVQVRTKIRIHGNGVAAVLRFRQLTSFQDDSNRTNYIPGDLQVINVDANDTVQDHLFAYVPCNIGESAVLIGAPGRAVVTLLGVTQAAALKRKGFLAYTSGFGPPIGEAPVIYKKEEVLFGNNPGCPNPIPPEEGRPPRTYSGYQEFQPAAATDATNWIADPAGLYNSTLSADLVEDNYASKPFGSITDSAEFGVTEYREMEKDSVEKYLCGTNQLEKILNLGLTEAYPASDMIDAVDAAIDLQATMGLQRLVDEGQKVVMHKYFLSPGKTIYDRIHTSTIQASASNPLVLSYTNGAVLISLSCLETIRHFDGSGSTEAPKLFTALLYGDNVIGLSSLYGRDALSPAQAGEPDVDPQENPWGDLGQQSVEVVLKKLKAKPHNLLVHQQLFCEPESVIAEGVDGL